MSICNISDQKRGLISSVYKASERRKCPIKALHKLVLKLPAPLVNLGSSLCSGLDHGLSIRPTGSPGQAVKRTPCQCLPASWGRRCPGPPCGEPGWRTGAQGDLWAHGRGRVPVCAWLPVAQVSETFLPSPISLSLSCSPPPQGLLWGVPFPFATGCRGHLSLVVARLPRPLIRGPLQADVEAGLLRVAAVAPATTGCRGISHWWWCACLAPSSGALSRQMLRQGSSGWWRHPPRTQVLLIHLRSYLGSSCRVNPFLVARSCLMQSINWISLPRMVQTPSFYVTYLSFEILM